MLGKQVIKLQNEEGSLKISHAENAMPMLSFLHPEI